jgi:hypothetical protein
MKMKPQVSCSRPGGGLLPLVSTGLSALPHLLCVAVLCLAATTLLQAGEEKRSLTQAEIPASRDQMPDYILAELKNDPFIKEHFGWKLAFCQHPMYLLIDEDRGEPTVGERVPPWGAAEAKDYVERVRRNLQSLENLPELKLNYQWSAMELRSMARRFPDVYDRIKKLYEKGSLDFLDGTYSQAHLHVLGSESNWRQFEYGLEVYRELFEKDVDVYARQETGLHLQLPQLLKLFGYEFACLPAFIGTVEVFDGRFGLVGQEGVYETVTGDEFVEAVGLDGSAIPMYLQGGLGWEEEKEHRELQQDLYSGPKIWFAFPDLSEVDDETFEEYRLLFDWVLLRDALVERWRVSPARAKARLFSYWSYIEGVWAEELLRKMKSAEEMAVLAEQMSCMAKLGGQQVGRGADIKQIWKTILKSQHHDISWIEVTDLRRKSINRLKKAIDSCNDIMGAAGEKLIEKDNSSVAVFNGLPRARECLVELEGEKTLGKGSKFQAFKGQSLGFVDVPAGGYKSFKVVKTAVPSNKTAIPGKLKTNHYSIEFSENGLIEQMTTHKGEDLLSAGQYLGGEIRARVDKKWVGNRRAKCTYYSGKVADILERTTSLAEIPVLERYYFFRDEPVIKVEIEFDFNGNEVGYFWIDKTKINIYYPTRGAEVYHDIPFGYVEAKQGKPVFATNWLYCGGLVYVNRGTVKHWVEDGVVANVVGWGGNHFSNRLHWDWLESPQYDIRLHGKQKIEYYLIPYGEFDGAGIVQAVADVTSPVFICEGKGEKSFYQIKDKNLAVTSLHEKQGRIWARGYKLPPGKKSRYRDWEIFNTPIEKIKPSWFFGL